MKNIKKIIFIICFPIFAFGQNGITLSAIPDASRIVENEYFKVTFTLTNASWDRFTPPQFKGMEQRGIPYQSSSTSIINGKKTTSQSVVYSVYTKKIGRYKVGPAKAMVNGKEMKTAPFTIEVVKGKKKSTTNANTQDQYFVDVQLSDSIVRIGQQIQVDYKLYTKINVQSFDIGDNPNYDGFYAQDIRRVNYQTQREEFNGEMYMTKIFKRMALYPQQAGLLTIEPLELQLGIDVGNKSGRRSSFFFNEVKYYPYVVDSVKVKVLPLPTENVPTSFSGAIGKYQMRSSVDKRSMTTDQAMTITMSVEGNGDIKRVKAPNLGLGDDFEVYEPSILEEKTYEDGGQIIGRKIFEYQVLPLVPGNYYIQPKFTFYDSDSLKFMTLAAERTTLEVTKGKKKRQSKIAKKSEETKLTLLPNKEKTSLQSKDNFFFGSPFFWILGILPLLILGGALVYRQRQINAGLIDFTVVKSQQAQKVAVKKLALAEQFLKTNDSRNFYDEISKASFGYVSDKLNMPLSELSKTNIAEKLQSLNVNQQHVDDIIKIIKTCEMALFAGMDNSDSMNETYQNTKEVIVKIEEELS